MHLKTLINYSRYCSASDLMIDLSQCGGISAERLSRENKDTCSLILRWWWRISVTRRMKAWYQPETPTRGEKMDREIRRFQARSGMTQKERDQISNNAQYLAGLATWDVMGDTDYRKEQKTGWRWK
jgi:hypothetical protein